MSETAQARRGKRRRKKRSARIGSQEKAKSNCEAASVGKKSAAFVRPERENLARREREKNSCFGGRREGPGVEGED